MSRVIRYALWQEEPRSIDVPPAPTVEEQEEKSQYEAELERLEEQLVTLRQEVTLAKDHLEEVQDTSRRLLEDAKIEARKLVDEANARVEEIERKAQIAGDKRGYKDGYETGQEQATAESKSAIENAIQGAENIMNAALEARRGYLAQAENDVVEVAMAVVDKVLPQHFIDAPTIILPLVQKALMKVKDQAEVKINVSPEVYEFVIMAQSEFQSQLEGKATLSVYADKTLAQGDCVIETPSGNVDARLATQLEMIKQAVQEVKQ